MTKEQVINETHEHITTVAKFLAQMIGTLLTRALEHDDSKLKNPELDVFVEYTPKLKNSTYGSDEYKGFLKGMKVALDHHYANNRHHPEYQKDGIGGMNLVDLIELLCDWKAATIRHANGDIMKSIEINTKRFNLSDQLKNVLKNTVKDMGW